MRRASEPGSDLFCRACATRARLRRSQAAAKCAWQFQCRRAAAIQLCSSRLSRPGNWVVFADPRGPLTGPSCQSVAVVSRADCVMSIRLRSCVSKAKAPQWSV